MSYIAGFKNTNPNRFVSHVLGSVHYWLVTYEDSCIEQKDCRYITSPIGYWGKGLVAGWY